MNVKRQLGMSSRWDFVAHIVQILVLVAGLGAAGVAAVQEWQVSKADADLAAVDFDPTVQLPFPAATAHWPPRAALSEALAQARVAAADSAIALRAVRLKRVHALLAAAEAGRPGWYLVDVVASYVATVEHGASSREAIGAFEASYVGGRFLRDAAPWRIRYGLDQWQHLDRVTRRRLVEETAWFSTLPGGYLETMSVLVGHPAEVAVMRERANLMRGSAQ